MKGPGEETTVLEPRRSPDIRITDFLVLMVPCLVPALGLLARNPVGVPHAERLFAVSFLLWFVVAGLTLHALRSGAHRSPTMVTVFVAAFIVTKGEGFINQFGYGLGLLLATALLALVGVVAFRLRDTPISNVLIYAMAVALVTGPIIEAVGTLSAYGSSARVVPPALEVELVENRPDIWLLVLDGHPGLQAIEQDFGQGTAVALARRLRSAGFDVPESAWTSYWTTDYSVSSLLEMTFPTSSVDRVDATTQDLYRVIAGDNRLVSALESDGYETHMVESGWSGSACGRQIDRCIASAWLDESMFLLLSPSVLNEFVLESFGYAFTAGTKTTMGWLLDNADRLSRDGRPSFVFAHLMVPHPPFLLGPDCELVYEDPRSGVNFQRTGVSPELREEFLKDQMACAERFVIDLANKVDTRSVVVLLSDHGTDRRSQLGRSADEWEGVDIVERMNALVAVKGLSGCPFHEPILVPNVMSHVLSCLSDDEIRPIEPRFHLGPGHELTEDEFRQRSGLSLNRFPLNR